jgi:hypothetical protein
MCDQAMEWNAGWSAPVRSCARSTTPRRNVRESSLGRAGAEREVDDAREGGRRNACERDEGEDAAARRALNDTPDPMRDGGPERNERCREKRADASEQPVPDDRGRDTEAEAGERSPASAYRCRAAKRAGHGRHDEGTKSFVRVTRMQRTRTDEPHDRGAHVVHERTRDALERSREGEEPDAKGEDVEDDREPQQAMCDVETGPVSSSVGGECSGCRPQDEYVERPHELGRRVIGGCGE